MRAFIPYNVSDGQISVADNMLKTRNLLEGLFLSVIPFVVTFKFTDFLSLSNRLTVSVVTALPLLVLGLNGINGNCLSEFVMIYLKFLKNREMLSYDTRIKTEPEKETIEKTKSRRRRKNVTVTLSDDIFNENNEK